MKLYPTSGDSNSIKTQRELPVTSSRSSLRNSGATGARGSCERKEDLFEIAADRQAGRSCQLGQRADAHHAAAAEQHEPVAYPLGVAELVDRQHQGAAINHLVSQQVHHFACLTQIEAVKRLVHKKHGARYEEPERQQKSPPISLGQCPDWLAQRRLQTED